MGRELDKYNGSFTWGNTLNQIFINVKDIIVSKVQEDIHTVGPQQTDWSKEVIGFLLLQNYCECTLDRIPTSCHEDWRLVFTESQSTSPAETRYYPTEGELLAVRWALDNAKLFVLGGPNLTIVTDDKPLLGILNNRDLCSMSNSQLCPLKEKTFQYQFIVDLAQRS